jgi:hypothetical protein
MFIWFISFGIFCIDSTDKRIEFAISLLVYEELHSQKLSENNPFKPTSP